METKTRYYIVRQWHGDVLYRLLNGTVSFYWQPERTWFDDVFLEAEDLLTREDCEEISEEDAKLWLFENGN